MISSPDTTTVESARTGADEPPRLEQLEVDGVPVFRTPKPGSVFAALMFGAGRADETVTTAGITHLVEHLAMLQVGSDLSEWNASTGPTRTIFYGHGDPDAVAGRLEQVCRALSSLPLDGIERETRVLRTEAAGWAPDPPATMLWYREGNRGHGLRTVPEYFHRNPDPGQVDAWAKGRFTADNASLAIAGDLPANLRLPLPRGQRQHPAELRGVPGLTLPSYVVHQPGGVGISFVVERNSATVVTLAIAAQRVQARLRQDLGLIYGVEGHYEPLSAERAYSALWARCLDPQAAEVVHEMLTVLRELARTGPSDEELERDRTTFAESLHDESVALRQSDYAAACALMGAPILSHADLSAERAGVTAASGAAAMAAALGSALMMAPPSAQFPGAPFNGYPGPTVDTSAGWKREFGHRSTRPWSRSGPRLTVGDKAVIVSTPNMLPRVVRWSDCVAVIEGPAGGRWIMGEDGYNIGFEPAAWRDGHVAGQLIDGLTPPGRFVPYLE